MIMGAKHICSGCGKHTETFWAGPQNNFMCAACQRLYNPPYMTLIKSDHGGDSKLWNLEVGEYEDFTKVSAIEVCNWMVRCKQETIFSLVPKVKATIYHLEYFGNIPCGRCVSYPFFEKGQPCLSSACEKLAKPFRPEKDIQYPPERSRYTTWMKKINHY